MATIDSRTSYDGMHVEREQSVSGFNNNCGLSSILGFVLDMVRHNPDDPVLKEEPYVKLLDYLNEFLDLPQGEKLKNYHDVKYLIETFPNHNDLEKIFSSPMRKILADSWEHYKDSPEAHKFIVGMNSTLFYRQQSTELGMRQETLDDEYADMYRANSEFFINMVTKSQNAQKIISLEEGLEILRGNGDIKILKRNLVEIVISESPGEPVLAKSIITELNLNEDEIMYAAAYKSKNEPKVWLSELKRECGTEPDGDIVITADFITKIKPYLHKIVANHEDMSRYERKELMDLLGAAIQGDKITFNSSVIEDIDFSGDVYEGNGRILPVKYQFSDPWNTPEQEILQHQIDNIKRSVGTTDATEIALMANASEQLKFAGDYVSGMKSSYKELFELALTNKETPSEKNKQRLSDRIAKYRDYCEGVEFNVDEKFISSLEEPSDENVDEFRRVLKQYETNSIFLKNFVDKTFDKWIEETAKSSMMVGQGVKVLSSYLGIDCHVYTSGEKFNLAEHLDGSSAVIYPDETNTASKTKVEFTDNRGLQIDEANKIIEFTIKDVASYKKFGSPGFGTALDISGITCPVVEVTENADGTVSLKVDYSSMLKITAADLKDKLAIQGQINPILPREHLIVDTNLSNVTGTRTLKIYNPGNIHWQREIPTTDVNYYREANRKAKQLGSISGFKKIPGKARNESDFYTDAEFSDLYRKMYGANQAAAAEAKKAPVYSANFEDYQVVIKERFSLKWKQALREKAAVIAGKRAHAKSPGALPSGSPTSVVDLSGVRTGPNASPSPSPSHADSRKKTAAAKTPVATSVIVRKRKSTVEPSRVSSFGSEPSSDGRKRRKTPSGIVESNLLSPLEERFKTLNGLSASNPNPLIQTKRAPSLIFPSSRHSPKVVEEEPSTQLVKRAEPGEFMHSIDMLQDQIREANEYVARDGAVLLPDHPKYNEFYDDDGSVVTEKSKELEFEIEKAKAFMGKKIVIETNADNEATSYMVSDVVTNEKIIKAETLGNTIKLRAYNKDDETIIIMLAPAIDYAIEHNRELMSIRVMDRNDPKYALQIFEKAMEHGLNPQIKDRETLKAIKDNGLSERYKEALDKMTSILKREQPKLNLGR